MCDVTPSAPTLHQILWTISLYGRWSTSGSDRGIAHFFLAIRNTIEGAGEKKRTNEQYAWVNSSARRELCNTAFPVYICRLTLAWIQAKILQRYKECQPILIGLLSLVLDSLMPTGLSAPVSGVDWSLSSPFANSSLLSPLCPTLSRVPLPLPVTSRSPVQNPLSGFAP